MQRTIRSRRCANYLIVLTYYVGNKQDRCVAAAEKALEYFGTLSQPDSAVLGYSLKIRLLHGKARAARGEYISAIKALGELIADSRAFPLGESFGLEDRMSACICLGECYMVGSFRETVGDEPTQGCCCETRRGNRAR